MSLVYSKPTNENIYNVEKPKTAKIRKPPVYQSKFKTQVREEIHSAKDSHRTMGFVATPLNPPNNFLRKNQGIRLKKSPDHDCTRESLRPPIPGRESSWEQATARHEVGYQDKRNRTSQSFASSGKNFRLENIRKVVKSAPRRPQPRFVDTRKGDPHQLLSSGLMPVYIYQPKYGNVPKYLVKRMDQIAREQELMSKAESEKAQTGVTYITPDERNEILNGLKKNWEELQKIYQGLPVLTDTIPKKNRKTKLEKELRQLEQDILLVERNPHIFVCEKTANPQ